MIILMFLLIAIAVVFATYNLYIIRSMPPEERYKLLYFKDDQVSIGIGLVRRTFKLSDIREVRFSKGKKFKKMQYITNEEIIDKSIDFLMNEFQARGIRCTKYRC